MNINWESELDRYFDQTLSEAELQSLQQWMLASPAHAQKFVEAALFHDQLRGQVVAASSLRDAMSDAGTCGAAGTIRDQESESDAGLLSEVGDGPAGVESGWLQASMGSGARDYAAMNRSPTDVPENGKSRSARGKGWRPGGALPGAWRGARRTLAWSAFAATLMLVAMLWLRGSETAEAGQRELRMVIAANAGAGDRGYVIHVESLVPGGAASKRRPSDDSRPPKPSLEGARLYVRGSRAFVLERQTTNGGRFITGCDGMVGWMVPPEGAVRVSHDRKRFDRDIPGHEYSMSLSNLQEALESLRGAYMLSVLPVEFGDGEEGNETKMRLLVATKRRGFPGPRRVEISYREATRQIEEIRFLEMPYGPDRQTVRLTRVEASGLGDDFFRSTTHHAADREVIQE